MPTVFGFRGKKSRATDLGFPLPLTLVFVLRKYNRQLGTVHYCSHCMGEKIKLLISQGMGNWSFQVPESSHDHIGVHEIDNCLFPWKWSWLLMSHFVMNAESLFTLLGVVISGLVELRIFSVWKPSHYSHQPLLRGRFPDLNKPGRIKEQWGGGELTERKTKLFKQKWLEFNAQGNLVAVTFQGKNSESQH